MSRTWPLWLRREISLFTTKCKSGRRHIWKVFRLGTMASFTSCVEQSSLEVKPQEHEIK
jgi:hypothetical protein